MTTTHVEHEDDYTERVAPVRTGYTDPHEPTGSELETRILDALATARRRRTALGDRDDNSHKWRMYHRKLRDGTIAWYAHQPVNMAGTDKPHFTGQTGTPQKAYFSFSGLDALAQLQLALAKAAA